MMHSVDPSRAPMTGLLRSHASRYAIPNDSAREGIANTSSASNSDDFSSSEKGPVMITRDRSTADSESSDGDGKPSGASDREAPPPASNRRARGTRRHTSFMAEMRMSMPLDGTIRPM